MAAILLALALEQDVDARVKALVERLASDSVVESDEARTQIIDLGPAAIPALDRAHAAAKGEARGRIDEARWEIARRKHVADCKPSFPAALLRDHPDLVQNLTARKLRTRWEQIDALVMPLHAEATVETSCRTGRSTTSAPRSPWRGRRSSSTTLPSPPSSSPSTAARTRHRTSGASTPTPTG